MDSRKAQTRWGKAGIEAIKKYYDSIGKGDRAFFLKPDIPIYTMTEGDHVLRFMPPRKDGDFFGLEIYVHSGIGVNKDSFLCTAKTKIFEGKGICPICAKAQKLSSQNAPDEEIIPFKARKRVLFNVVDMDKVRDGVKIWVAPVTAADEIVRLCYDKRNREFRDITDPVKGYDVYITREGEGLNTRYRGIQLDPNPSSIDISQFEIFDLVDALLIPDERDILLALEGHVEDYTEPFISDTPDVHNSASKSQPDEKAASYDEVDEEPESPTMSVRDRLKMAAEKRYRKET